MAENRNVKQMAGHFCKKILTNSWCIHKLIQYINDTISDQRLNEQAFKVIAQSAKELKDAAEIMGYINSCVNCQQLKSQLRYEHSECQRQQEYQQVFSRNENTSPTVSSHLQQSSGQQNCINVPWQSSIPQEQKNFSFMRQTSEDSDNMRLLEKPASLSPLGDSSLHKTHALSKP